MCIVVDSELLLVVFEASLELFVKLIIVLQLFQPNLHLPTFTQLLKCRLFLKKDSRVNYLFQNQPNFGCKYILL